MGSEAAYSFYRLPGVALYQQIKDMLRAEISQMPYGEQIPSEQQLMERYGVSRGPIRQAITELVYEGFLYRMQGKGTFRAGATINYSHYTVNSLTEQLIRSGMQPGIQDVRLESVVPPPQVARYLQPSGATEVWMLSRVRTADGEPICYSRGYIIKEIIPTLWAGDLDMSIVDMLKNKFQIALPKSRSLCTAIKADGLIAEKLGIKQGEAIFHIEFVCSNEEGRHVFVDVSDANGEKYVMRIEQR